MANIVKRVDLSNGDKKVSLDRIVQPNSQSDLPENCRPEQKGQGFYSIADLHRARFLQIIHPGLRQLRARNLPPQEREMARKSLLELLLCWVEKKLEEGL